LNKIYTILEKYGDDDSDVTDSFRKASKEDKEESEILPLGCNKSVCTGKCKQCCPAYTGNKRNAGPKCKDGCPMYDRAFK
jgi:hypothetical protein